MLEESGVVEPAVNLLDPYPGQEENTELYRMASLGDRFIAFALDTIFLFGVFAILDAWAFMRWGLVEGLELKLTTASLLMAEFLNGVVLFIYLWLLEAGFGATLGKAIVGIRVVRTVEGNPLVAFAIRNLMRIVDGFGFYLLGAVVAGCSRFRRRLGDICARTVVVEEEFGYAVKILAVVLWAGVLAGAMWSVPRICARNPAKQVRYLDQVVVEVGRVVGRVVVWCVVVGRVVVDLVVVEVEDVLVLARGDRREGDLVGLTGNYIEVAFPGPEDLRRRVARVLVTDRIKPLQIEGRPTYRVGMPYHWGGVGIVTGDSANDLLPLVLDNNVHISEYKVATCDIRPGRRPRGPARLKLVEEYRQRAGVRVS